ncbi:MAG: V-type ATP synthase subunit A [candidate division WOR-3 bacterium]|nr:V-type ATP synthase subunit A [candidate division WOR-3 bacterium]MCR4424087.1 V-type ATP synthase subunit A [candidate division WOR-3 bacterium]MDH7519494.1 V-type ATP synthase subunit A [bacterium]
MSEVTGTIIRVSGPLVVARGMAGSKMYDVVRVSEKRLLGEIIQLRGDEAAIQVYEETAGIGPGEPVYPTYEPLSVELGPGLLETIYDGVQRPLHLLEEKAGYFITRGIEVPALSRERKWHFVPLSQKGDTVGPGDVIGEVAETVLVKHRILVPPGVQGRVREIAEGDFCVTDTVAVLETETGEQRLTMVQRWPVRQPRPVRRRLAPDEPLLTGQRIIDTFFPIAKGGTACVPGPFGSGKTVIQHQFAEWSDADIVIFVGCGERGNEMTDVLLEFPKLKDPKSGEPLMKRTVLIANTSNMPVAAREASVYTAITIGEYFRDMGYSVALQADSTSRWAEAMREISGRLEEMPGEEGYPAYLATRIAEFYERAGRVICLGRYQGKEMAGSLTVIGSVSPPGGDLNDPVVQATLRVVKVFWSLEDKLAFQRHFPAISWLRSYSLYTDVVAAAMAQKTQPDFPEHARQAMALLQKEAELEEIVRLVGKDTLSAEDRLVLEVARSLREDFLHQNAFHEIDTYTSLKKQAAMLAVILKFYALTREALNRGAEIDQIEKLPVRERIARMKFIPEEEFESALNALHRQLEAEINGLSKNYD